ncbi:MAG: hypothetical protein KIT81_08925 [Alphaproteobacteria bacterium]|nr:hypothetical protein [Alphaproteobacteria bacterium]
MKDKETSGGTVVSFQPAIVAQAVLGVSLNAKDGSVVLAIQTDRGQRAEISMPGDLAEVVVAAIGRVLQQAQQSRPAP